MKEILPCFFHAEVIFFFRKLRNFFFKEEILQGST